MSPIIEETTRRFNELAKKHNIQVLSSGEDDRLYGALLLILLELGEMRKGDSSEADSIEPAHLKLESIAKQMGWEILVTDGGPGCTPGQVRYQRAYGSRSA